MHLYTSPLPILLSHDISPVAGKGIVQICKVYMIIKKVNDK